MKEKLFQIALLLLLLGLAPIFFFFLKKEPAPKRKFESSKKQTIKTFIFTEIRNGEKRWILKSPQATFKGKDIFLQQPILFVFSPENSTIYANEAIYNKESNFASLTDVTLKSKEFTAKTSNGTFNGKEEKFISNSTCKIVFETEYSINGKKCFIDLKSGKVIISGGVSTIIQEKAKGESK